MNLHDTYHSCMPGRVDGKYFKNALFTMATITSKATRVSIRTPPCYKHLFYMQKMWTLEVKQSSTLWLNGYLTSTVFKTLEITQHTSPYILHTEL
jgi:hypothetical protein